MNDELKRQKLYKEAFSLTKKLQELLLKARAAHEKDAGAVAKAA